MGRPDNTASCERARTTATLMTASPADSLASLEANGRGPCAHTVHLAQIPMTFRPYVDNAPGTPCAHTAHATVTVSVTLKPNDAAGAHTRAYHPCMHPSKTQERSYLCTKM